MLLFKSLEGEKKDVTDKLTIKMKVVNEIWELEYIYSQEDMDIFFESKTINIEKYNILLEENTYYHYARIFLTQSGIKNDTEKFYLEYDFDIEYLDGDKNYFHDVITVERKIQRKRSGDFPEGILLYIVFFFLGLFK